MSGNKLLIIGNGFDLNCGLKSSFSDYINQKEPNVYNKIIKFKKGIMRDYPFYYFESARIFWKNNDFSDRLSTLEKLILIGTSNIKEISWFDVERFLYSLLEGEQNFDYICDLIYDYELSWKQEIDPNDTHNKFEIITISDLSAAIFYFDNISEDNDSPIKLDVNYKEVLYKELNNDLRKFEKEFTNYLKKEVKDNKKYSVNVENLFQKIGRTEKDSILTFNYTHISNSHNLTEMVHGSLDTNSIIIGIDSTNIKHFKPSYKFTKTYRKVEKYFMQQNKVINAVISRNYDEIIFYGHSLNEQDYAYFQTIFDKQDLYNSNVKLTFKYSIYDEDIKDLIIENNISSIIALIESYGNTLDNKHKGKNLLHKLLNESRIKVVEI